MNPPNTDNIESGDVVHHVCSLYGFSELRKVKHKHSVNPRKTDADFEVTFDNDPNQYPIREDSITAHYIPWQRHEAIVAEMKAENADLRKQLADDQEMLTITYMIGSQDGKNGVKGQSDD